jgi:hypothetical protein
LTKKSYLLNVGITKQKRKERKVKRIYLSLSMVVLFAGITMGACAGYSSYAPVPGSIYSNVEAPVAVTPNTGGAKMKMGEGEVVSILGIIALGDVSIETIAKQAGITKIHHVDTKFENYVSVYSKLTVRVYGY